MCVGFLLTKVVQSLSSRGLTRSNFFWTAIVLSFSVACGGKIEPSPGGATEAMSAASSPVSAGRWTVGSDLSRYDLLAVDFVDAQKGWAVGDISPEGGPLLRTTDGGSSWKAVAKITEVFAALHFHTPARGWMAGYAGRIERTDDGGVTWRTQRFEKSGDVLNSICFLDGERGWAAGGRGLLLRTVDGGKTWETTPTNRVEDFWTIRFATPERGFIVGEDGLILLTSDGGKSWEAQKSGTTTALFGLAITTGGTLIAVGQGGAILRSEDGRLWHAVPSGTTKMLNAVAAAGDTLWAVGAGGVTLQSVDGGRSWVVVPTDAGKHWLAIDLTGPASGLAVGRRGAVQRLQ